MAISTYPPHPRLAGARLKVGRAQYHLKAVEDEVNRVTGPNAYAVVPYTEDEGRKHIWRVEGLRPVADDLALWIGDCLHNFRSVLDHIAYELIRNNGLTPTERTMFPLLADKPAKSVYIGPDPGPHADAMEIVREVQPYNGGNHLDPLALLNHLDIVDKHRKLLPVVGAVKMGWHGSPPSPVKVLESWYIGDPVKDGDIVMWAKLDVSQPKGALDGDVRLCVKLGDGFIPAPFAMTGPIDSILHDIANQIDDLLGQFDWFFATHP